MCLKYVDTYILATCLYAHGNVYNSFSHTTPLGILSMVIHWWFAYMLMVTYVTNIA